MELLWQDGHIVTHSLANPPPTKAKPSAAEYCRSLREAEAYEEEYHHLFSQGDETALWLSCAPWMNNGITTLAAGEESAAVLAVINNIGDAVEVSSWLERNRAPAAGIERDGVGQGGLSGFWHRGADESMVVDQGGSVDDAGGVGAVAPVSSGDGELEPPLQRKDGKRKRVESDGGGERDEVV